MVGFTVVVLRQNKMRFFLLLCLSIISSSVFVSCKQEQKSTISNLKSKPKIYKVSKETPKEIDEAIDKNFVLGKFNYRKDTSFVKVNNLHVSKTIYLQKRVYKEFVRMYTDAKSENIDLKIISGTRNFYEQKNIWLRKWKKYKSFSQINRAKKILEYSSMPSTSRHHWGTDIDLNNLNNSYFEKGKGAKEYQWLKTNANRYGFYQVYTSKKNGRTGYNMEKWHWSYMPLAKKYLDYYNSNISYDNIKSFDGSELAKELNIIKNFVNGVSTNLSEVH